MKTDCIMWETVSAGWEGNPGVLTVNSHYRKIFQACPCVQQAPRGKAVWDLKPCPWLGGQPLQAHSGPGPVVCLPVVCWGTLLLVKAAWECSFLTLIRIVISDFGSIYKRTHFRFHSPSLKIFFSLEDVWLFLLVRQALPRAWGTFREATSIETAQLLSHSPETFGVMNTKGASQPHSFHFICFFQLLHL